MLTILWGFDFLKLTNEYILRDNSALRDPMGFISQNVLIKWF